MKKLLLTFVVFSMFGISACDLFNTDDDPSGEGDCKIIGWSFDIPNDPAREEASFTYDNDDRLTSIIVSSYDRGDFPYVRRTALSYSGEQVETVNTYSKLENNPEERDFKYEFYYESGRPDSIHLTGYNAYAGTDSYILLEYAGDKPSESRRYNYNSIIMYHELGETISYEWDGNNLIKSVRVDTNGNSNTTEYTYDTMNRAYGNQALAYVQDLSLLSENNVLSVTRSSQFGSNTDNFSFTYNDEGYPATSTQGMGYPLYEYEYDCN